MTPQAQTHNLRHGNGLEYRRLGGSHALKRRKWVLRRLCRGKMKERNRGVVEQTVVAGGRAT